MQVIWWENNRICWKKCHTILMNAPSYFAETVEAPKRIYLNVCIYIYTHDYTCIYIYINVYAYALYIPFHTNYIPDIDWHGMMCPGPARNTSCNTWFTAELFSPTPVDIVPFRTSGSALGRWRCLDVCPLIQVQWPLVWKLGSSNGW